VVSSTRKDFPWANSHHIAGDLRAGVQKLKDATPDGVLLGSGKLATELDRLDLIDEYMLLVHPRIAGHGPPCTRVAAQHATTRVGLGEAASQRRGRHALPARALTRRWVMSPNSTLHSDFLALFGAPVRAGVWRLGIVPLRATRYIQFMIAAVA
jgi:hypothetical protein